MSIRPSLPGLIRCLLSLLLATSLRFASAQACHFGQGQAGIDADVQQLRAQPTCQQAYALYNKCLWGSSADQPRADAVRQTCQAAFQHNLNPAQQTVLTGKLNLCVLEYKDMDGTMWLSAASSCQLEVYVDFATDPAKASQPIPRASFNCDRAKTPLEHSVCNNPELGQFDLLMARAYKTFLGELKDQDKASLLHNQRAWNAHTPAACSLTSAQPAPATLACLGNRYRERMQALNGCAAGADLLCLERTPANEPLAHRNGPRHTIN